MNWREKENQQVRGGILADEPGLGKTLTSIANIMVTASCGSTLIVCPGSLLSQWEKEILRHTKNVNVIIYHGSTRKATIDLWACNTFVLTTYGILTSEFQKRQKKVSSLEPKKSLFSSPFLRIVLDEGHAIKNSQVIICTY